MLSVTTYNDQEMPAANGDVQGVSLSPLASWSPGSNFEIDPDDDLGGQGTLPEIMDLGWLDEVDELESDALSHVLLHGAGY